jgi:hypothetical protein
MYKFSEDIVVVGSDLDSNQKEFDMEKINGRKVFGAFLIGFGLFMLFVGGREMDTLSTFESYGGNDITFAGYLSVIGEWVGYFGLPALLIYLGYRKIKKAE